MPWWTLTTRTRIIWLRYVGALINVFLSRAALTSQCAFLPLFLQKPSFRHRFWWFPRATLDFYPKVWILNKRWLTLICKLFGPHRLEFCVKWQLLVKCFLPPKGFLIRKNVRNRLNKHLWITECAEQEIESFHCWRYTSHYWYVHLQRSW